MTQSFALTPEQLRKAQRFIDDAAAQVRQQFTALANTVAAQTNRGAAAQATQAVALELQAQAKKFDQTISDFAEQIGAANKTYVANSEAGVQTMQSVLGAVPATGASYSRLTGN